MKFLAMLLLACLSSLGAAVVFEGCTGNHSITGREKSNEQKLSLTTLESDDGREFHYFRDNGNICYMRYDSISCVKDTK